MRELVRVERAQLKIRSLVDQATVFGAQTEVIREVKIGAAAIEKRATRLPVRTVYDELIGRIEGDRSAAAQGIGPNASQPDRDVRHEGRGCLVNVRLQRRGAAEREVVLRVSRVTIVPFNSEPF